MSRKLSEFDNRGAQALRSKGYKGINDPVRYKGNNYDDSDNAILPHKMSMDHSSSVSGIDMRNNARYRVDSGSKANLNSDAGSGYGISRHGNQVAASNSNNLNNL